MGKQGRKKRSKNDKWKQGKNKKQKNVWDQDKTKPQGYYESRKNSNAFEKYYKAQGIVSPDEWPEFLKVNTSTIFPRRRFWRVTRLVLLYLIASL